MSKTNESHHWLRNPSKANVPRLIFVLAFYLETKQTKTYFETFHDKGGNNQYFENFTCKTSIQNIFLFRQALVLLKAPRLCLLGEQSIKEVKDS